MWKRIVLGVVTITGVALAKRTLNRFDVNRRRVRHVSESEESYQHARSRILILGAGFGGLATALQLDQRLKPAHDSSILVIDRNNDLLFTPLLWTVAAGRANPNNVVVPIRNFQKGRRFHVLHADVEYIDLDRKEVKTSADSRPYDTLVIALGSHTVLPDLPGLREYGRPFHTPADALELRNHLIDAIEAAHHADTSAQRQSWLTFVIGGAGDTGIELAAIIHDYIITGLFGEYPWLADESVRVIVIGRADRVLPMGEPHTSDIVRSTLEKEGIEVLTSTSVKAITEATVETTVGVIPARTFFWAAGITAPEVVSNLPVKHARNGAVMVDNYLRIPDYPDVYVIGDSAWAYDSTTGDPVPATAQASRQQGHYVGTAIAMEHAGVSAHPYRYSTLGHLALLGRKTGVAEIGRSTLTGVPAWLLWHLAYLLRIPSWNKRIRLVGDWLFSGMFGRETGQLRLGVGLDPHRKVHPAQTVS